MKVSLELLFHHRCGKCDRWWSISDIPPKEKATCPHCGTANKVEDTQYPLSGVLSAEEIKELSDLLYRAHLKVKESADLAVHRSPIKTTSGTEEALNGLANLHSEEGFCQ